MKLELRQNLIKRPSTGEELPGQHKLVLVKNDGHWFHIYYPEIETLPEALYYIIKNNEVLMSPVVSGGKFSTSLHRAEDGTFWVVRDYVTGAFRAQSKQRCHLTEDEAVRLCGLLLQFHGTDGFRILKNQFDTYKAELVNTNAVELYRQERNEWMNDKRRKNRDFGRNVGSKKYIW